MYYIRNNNSVIAIDGEERYYAVCDKCGRIFGIETDDFYSIAEEGELFNIKHYCNDCLDISAENNNYKYIYN